MDLVNIFLFNTISTKEVRDIFSLLIVPQQAVPKYYTIIKLVKGHGSSNLKTHLLIKMKSWINQPK